MTPQDIQASTEGSIANCGLSGKVGNVSDKFKDHFRDFVETNLVQEIRRVRESIGLKTENVTAA